MLAGKYNIVCDQGSTFIREFTVRDSAGLPYNLTGYSARMQVRKDVDSTTVLLEATVANGRITMAPNEGVITVTFAPSVTATLTRSGVYDLEVFTTGNGDVQKVVRGEFRLEKEVTR